MDKRKRLLGENMSQSESKLGRIIFARFSEDEDLLESITTTAEQNKIHAGIFFLIGTLKEAKLGFYEKGEYKTIEIREPLEILSCLGNISLKEETMEVIVHAHLTVSNLKGEAFGGHLLKGCKIGATAELTLIEAVGVKLMRKFDTEKKLYLWKFKAT
ncbi:MAG: DNA-binding protein [Candidatus Bathyarchaeia archaeon]